MTRNLTNMDAFRTFTNVIYDGVYIDPIVKSITWSGDVNQAFRKLDITLSNTLDGRTRALTFEKGRELRLVSDEAELFHGVIFTDTIDAAGQATITAYDENVYLTKSIDTKLFMNMTAAGIVRALCSEFDIPLGSIADTGYMIPNLLLRDRTLWEMMITALTETRKHTGRRFFIYSQDGRLNLLERKARVVEFVLDSSTNVTGASYRQSIEDLRNQVKVTGGDPDKNPIVATVKSDALIAKYGLMQHLENANTDATQSQIEQKARQLLADIGKVDDQAEIQALGYDDAIAGASAYVYEPMTGIVGSYYIAADTHTFENGIHTMSLTLSATDDLPTMEYVPPAEPRDKKAANDAADYAAAIARLDN